jgi:lysophospholipase L1-like esterase
VHRTLSKASKARKIATAAAYGGGGLGALGALGGAALYGLIVGETKLARRRIPEAEADPPASDATVWSAAGVSRDRPPLRLAVLGDSTAAGYGVHSDRDTPAAQLAIKISAVARRPVYVRNVAKVGAQSAQLPLQLERLGADRADLAAIMVGANDVTHRVRQADAVAHLRGIVTELRARGAEVVVATCPDLGTIRPIAQPLRYFARRLSRRMAAAQTIAVVEAGGRTVSLGDLLGPLFASRRELFSDDRFHPSAAGYAAAVEALLPSALDALGLQTRSRSASPFTTQRRKPVAKAAVQAAARPGSEVAASTGGVATRGRRGPLARLRRRKQVATARTD